MSSGQDAKFFTRGKIQEFRKELQDAEHKDRKFVKRKTILKKIVANITMGNDMSPLFSDVVHFLSIPNLEIKKMVYLFIVSYGRYHPEQIQFAIPNFQEIGLQRSRPSCQSPRDSDDVIFDVTRCCAGSERAIEAMPARSRSLCSENSCLMRSEAICARAARCHQREAL